MSSISLKLKREAAILGYNGVIRSITGSNPHVSRHSDGAQITMSASQAKKIENYLGAKIPFNFFYLKEKLEEKKAEKEGESLNVSVNWGAVLTPLAIKTTLPPLILYSIFLLYIGKKGL